MPGPVGTQFDATEVLEGPHQGEPVGHHPLHLAWMAKARLRGLILSYPELSIGMLRSLSLRLREANTRSMGKPDIQGEETE